jgi:hypothetical protein
VDALDDALHPREGVRDELLEGQRARARLGDEVGDLRAALLAAKGRAHPAATRHELEGTRRDLLARGGDADDDGLAPALRVGGWVGGWVGGS